MSVFIFFAHGWPRSNRFRGKGALTNWFLPAAAAAMVNVDIKAPENRAEDPGGEHPDPTRQKSKPGFRIWIRPSSIPVSELLKFIPKQFKKSK